MDAILSVLHGAKEGDFPLIGKKLYVAIREVKKKPSIVTVGSDVSEDDRVAELSMGRGFVLVRNLRPWQMISVNGSQNLDQGERATLRDGDEFKVRDVVLRLKEVEVEGASDDGAKEEEKPTEGAGEADGVQSKIIETHDPRDTADISKLLAGATPARLQKQLECLQLAGNVALRAAGTKELMSGILEVLGEQFKSAHGSILWRVGEGESFKRLAKLRQEADEVRVSRTVLKHVLDTSESVLSVDTAGDPRLAKAQSLHNKQMRSVLCIPILRDGKVRGVIQLDDVGVKKFNEGDQALVGAIAATVTTAITAIEARAAAVGADPESDDAAPGEGGGLGALRDAAGAWAPEQLTIGDLEVVVGFIGGDGILNGTFAAAVPGAAGAGAVAPVMFTAGELTGDAPQNVVAAYHAQVAAGTLAREGLGPERIVRQVYRGLADAGLPTLRSSLSARFEAATGLVVEAGDGTGVVHRAALDGQARVLATPPPAAPDAPPAWSTGTLPVAPGDAVVLFTRSMLELLGGDTAPLANWVMQAGGSDPAALVRAITEGAGPLAIQQGRRAVLIGARRADG